MFVPSLRRWFGWRPVGGDSKAVNHEQRGWSLQSWADEPDRGKKVAKTYDGRTGRDNR